MASLALAILPFSSPKPSQFLQNPKRNYRFNVLCNVENGDRNLNPNLESVETSHGKVDRRNMLIGLGGLYGAANMIGDQVALAKDSCSPGKPIPYPNLPKCGPSIMSGTTIEVPYSCCPPLPKSEILPYKFPKKQVKRVRPAAHKVDYEYIEKYRSAIAAMKNLPADDPHNFYQQANIHCSYCNKAYPSGKIDSNGNEIFLDVHGSWFFFPFHRWYLYFFEKILGTLIDDPTFALPYWNWDNPNGGMAIPDMFDGEFYVPKSPLWPPFGIWTLPLSNPLYDNYRNSAHLPPTLVDFSDRNAPEDESNKQKISNNLTVMRKAMIDNGSNAEAFMGKCYDYGDPKVVSGKGSLEVPHDVIHVWTGVPKPGGLGHGEDMANFYSAAKDPLFYCHHSNVDRMWSIWSGLKLNDRNFKNESWLDTQYFFYDENRNPVYVSIKDCLDYEKNMGYTYQPMERPWLYVRSKPTPKTLKPQLRKFSVRKLSGPTEFPVKLDKVLKVSVQRVKKNRTPEEKTNQQEILVLEGLNIPSDEYVRFDVFINDDDEQGLVLNKPEFAGFFASVPHGLGNTDHQMSYKQTFGLNELLEDLEAEDDDYIQVTLIPKSGCGNVTISNIKIDFSDNDTD